MEGWGGRAFINDTLIRGFFALGCTGILAFAGLQSAAVVEAAAVGMAEVATVAIVIWGLGLSSESASVWLSSAAASAVICVSAVAAALRLPRATFATGSCGGGLVLHVVDCRRRLGGNSGDATRAGCDAANSAGEDDRGSWRRDFRDVLLVSSSTVRSIVIVLGAV